MNIGPDALKQAGDLLAERRRFGFLYRAAASDRARNIIATALLLLAIAISVAIIVFVFPDERSFSALVTEAFLVPVALMVPLVFAFTRIIPYQEVVEVALSIEEHGVDLAVLLLDNDY